MLAISVGGRNITATTEKILMMLFCSRLMSPSTASSRTGSCREEARVVGERLHVAQRRFESAALVLRQRDVRRLLHVHQQALEAHQALARLRDQVPLTPILWIMACRSRWS